MLYFFVATTCSADLVFGVRLCFWVGHSGFYSLGSFFPLSLVLQFKVRLLWMFVLGGVVAVLLPRLLLYCYVV